LNLSGNMDRKIKRRTSVTISVNSKEGGERELTTLYDDSYRCRFCNAPKTTLPAMLEAPDLNKSHY